MISFVFAMDKNRVIGKENNLPWHLPADLAFFKRVTMGHPIIMGRKTYESIGKPLPGRTNIILTRDREFQPEGCVVFHSIESLLAGLDQQEEAFVIGGAELFKQIFPHAEKMYITLIDHEFDGDTFFPDFDQSDWHLVETEQGIKDAKNPYDFTFTIWEKATKTGGIATAPTA